MTAQQRSFPSVFDVLGGAAVREHAQLRAIRGASTATTWPITLRATWTASTLEITINETDGDDERGDGSPDRPFRSYDRAARAMGLDAATLRRAARRTSLPPLRRDPEPVAVPDVPTTPRNRHERRAAEALARRR